MDGEDKLTLLIIGIMSVCITVLYSFLFLALWDYRKWVGLSLLVLLTACVGVYLRGRVNEQDLRVTRYRHLEETPLDENNEPMHWRHDYLPNPHRH